MSIWPTTLSVDKQQSTYASALIAWGIARLLDDLLVHVSAQDKSITIFDAGSCFQIRIASSFPLAAVPFVPLLHPIRTLKQAVEISGKV